MKRLMSREMLRDLIDLVEPHKNKHPDLYDYLMLTWTSCNYNSTLYACNVDGMTIMQRHLSEFNEQDWRLYSKELSEEV